MATYTQYGTNGDDTLNLGDYESSLGSGDTFTYDGLGGHDRITGSSRGDDIRGGGDDDLLNGMRGNDRLDGGTGTDTASYVGQTGFVTASLLGPGPGEATVSLASTLRDGLFSFVVDRDELVSIENLTAGNDG